MAKVKLLMKGDTVMIKYLSQTRANIDMFMYGNEFKDKRMLLEKLIKLFEKNNIKWVLTCSADLFFQGIVDNFDDFDILISRDSVSSFINVMRELNAEIKPKGDQTCFPSSFFNKYEYVGKLGIDVISEWRIATFDTTYLCEYSPEQVVYVEIDTNVKVPVLPIEAQLLLYGMMVGWQPIRQFKFDLCKEFLEISGIQYPQILKEALENQNLPIRLKKTATELIS